MSCVVLFETKTKENHYPTVFDELQRIVRKASRNAEQIFSDADRLEGVTVSLGSDRVKEILKHFGKDQLEEDRERLGSEPLEEVRVRLYADQLDDARTGVDNSDLTISGVRELVPLWCIPQT